MDELRPDKFSGIDKLDFKQCSSILESIQRTFPNEPFVSTDPVIRRQHPRFSEIKAVGLGAFGVVFSAIDQDLNGKRIAIKILRPSKAEDSIAKQRFYDEAQNTAELVHPCIVTVYSIGEVDSIPYIVENLADRGSLAELLRENPTYFSCDQAAWMIMKLAEGLHYAHTNGTLHRDVKTGNILLRSDHSEWTQGASFWPMLSDFGLSKKFTEERNRSLTITGEVLGTVAYMSPEQVLSKKTTTQSDLFSIGIIFHEILYGVHPFLVESDYKTRRNIVESEPIKASVKGIRIPQDVAAIIDKCLKKQADERYTSARDLAIDLKCFLNGQPVSVRPPNALQSVRMLVHRHPIASTSLATLFASLLVFAIFIAKEWQVQRLLAEERKVFSELLQSSIGATNSDINDTILSGKRVRISELLALLNEQLPILEKAHELDPTNEKLIRNLKVMLHYASVCYYLTAESNGYPDDLIQITQAVENRKRSLRFIDILMQRDPENLGLMRDQINGEYWMGVLTDKLKDSTESREWNRRAIEHAQEYLLRDPMQMGIQETLISIRISYSESICQERPEEALEILQKVHESSLVLFSFSPSNINPLIYAVNALTDMGELLLEQGKSDESIQAFNQAELLIAERFKQMQEHWTVKGALLSHYCERSLASYQANQFDELIKVSQRWRDFINSYDDWGDFSFFIGSRQSKQSLQLLATYYWWLAIEKSERTSIADKERSLISLRDAIAKSKGDPIVDMATMIEVFKRMKVPTELLESQMEAVPGSP